MKSEVNSTSRRLHVNRNQFAGSVPSELGPLSRMDSFTIGDNFLQGSFPDSFTNLSNMNYLHFIGSGLCTPVDDRFLTWMATVDGVVYGPSCVDNKLEGD